MNGSKLHLTAWRVAKDERCSTQPALTRICRAIRVDALKFYYQNNDFTAGVCLHEHGKELQITWACLEQIGSTNMRLMRRLVISDHFADDDDIVDLQSEDSCLSEAEAAFVARWKARLEPLEGGTATERRVIFPASDA